MITEAPRRPRIDAVDRGANDVRLHFVLPADLFWFQGHFPGMPILPGVTQVDWAVGYAREYLELDLPAARLLKVKFRSIMQPGNALALVLRHRPDKSHLTFEYHRGGTLCASGQVTIAP